MADIFSTVQEKVAGKGVKIVFPEGMDERTLTAVQKLADGKVLQPIVVGKTQEVEAKAKELGLTLDGVDVYDPHTYEGFEELVQAFVER
ncbi:phosphate acyltransferase, partial [Bacillus sp. SIMBA_008]|uniref:phosphate acyltransferase n=1 Tax=Bacillus sp. SIMBA_008 TaxID=3085757 RepID=UPI00397C86D8